MSYDSHTSDSSTRSPLDRFGFEHLLAVTTLFVAGTIVLGVAARVTGSGLACDANWPVCDGGFLNLLPQGRPSFYEWIHRVVAGVAGLFIVGTAAAAWRAGSVGRRVTALVTLGLVLTPVQVLLGRETVLSYELGILSMHFWTAIAIFVVYVVAAVTVWSTRLTETHVTAALGLAAAAVPVQLVLSPLFIQGYTDVTMTIQMAATLTLVGAVILAAMVGPRRFADRRLVGALLATPVLTFLVLLLGRRSVMTFAPALDQLYTLATALLFAALLAAAWLARRDGGARRPLSA